MKQVIRLTESDLARIVKRTIREMDESDYTADDAMTEIGSYIDMVGCSEGRSRLLDDLSRMVDEAQRELSEEEFDKLTNYVYDLERDIYENCSDEEEEESLYESDLARIVKRVIKENSKENELDRFIKRRSELIDELIEKNIDEVEQEGTLFDDEFEFADNIINWVVQDMKVPDDIDESDIIDYIKDEHGEYIMSRFNSEDDEDDDDDDNWDDDDWDDDEDF